MPNQLLNTGLQIKSNTEITDDIVEELQTIYGSDINVAQNTPDGQLINIFAQAASDVLELLMAVYNSFAVDNATGKVLDQRVALNGITRRAGTYTQTTVTIVTDRALNLVGLDGRTEPNGTEFVVKDNSGNQFVLLLSESLPAAGTYIRNFRAVNIGPVEVVVNTITNQVTVIAGVTSINNPSSPTATGTNEETDAELKIRHARSFWLGSVGPVEAIQAALLDIASVTDAYVAENPTASTVNGIPAHGIWCIVEGGTDAEVAAAIYAKKAPGCTMKGSVTYTITRPAGNTFVAKFDRPVNEDLYVRFGITAKVSGDTFDAAQIKTQLVAALRYKLNQQSTVGDVVAAMLTIAPKGYLTNLGVSKNGTDYFDNVVPTDAQRKFVLTTGRITIT